MVKDYVPPKTEKKEMMCILITHIQHSESSSSHGNKTKKKEIKYIKLQRKKTLLQSTMSTYKNQSHFYILTMSMLKQKLKIKYNLQLFQKKLNTYVYTLNM